MTPGRLRLCPPFRAGTAVARRATTSWGRRNRHFLVRIRGETGKRRFGLASLACDPDELGERAEPATAGVEGLRGFLEGKVLSWTLGEALDPDKLERLGRYEVHLDRRLERMHTMLLRADLFGKTEVHPFGVARASRQAGLTIVTH